MASTILAQILENVSRGARLPHEASLPIVGEPPKVDPILPAVPEVAVESAGALMRAVIEEMDQRLSKMVEQVVTHPALSEGATPVGPGDPAPSNNSPPLIQGRTEAINPARAARLRDRIAAVENDTFEPIPETSSMRSPGTAVSPDSFPTAGTAHGGVTSMPVEKIETESAQAESTQTDSAPPTLDVEDSGVVEVNTELNSFDEPSTPEREEQVGDGESEQSEPEERSFEEMIAAAVDQSIESESASASASEPEAGGEINEADHHAESAEATGEEFTSAAPEINEPGERLLDLVGEPRPKGEPAIVTVGNDDPSVIEQVEAIVEEIASTCIPGVDDDEVGPIEMSQSINPALEEIRALLVPLQSVPSLLEKQGAPQEQILQQMQSLVEEVRELARAPHVAPAEAGVKTPTKSEDPVREQRRRVAIDDIQGMIQALS